MVHLSLTTLLLVLTATTSALAIPINGADLVRRSESGRVQAWLQNIPPGFSNDLPPEIEQDNTSGSISGTTPGNSREASGSMSESVLGKKRRLSEQSQGSLAPPRMTPVKLEASRSVSRPVLRASTKVKAECMSPEINIKQEDISPTIPRLSNDLLANSEANGNYCRKPGKWANANPEAEPRRSSRIQKKKRLARIV